VTYAADPRRTSFTLIFEESDSIMENTSAEMRRVADIQAGFNGTQRRTNTGIIRIATAVKTLRSFAAVVTHRWEKYVTTGSVALSPCFEGENSF